MPSEVYQGVLDEINRKAEEDKRELQRYINEADLPYSVISTMMSAHASIVCLQRLVDQNVRLADVYKKLHEEIVEVMQQVRS